MNKRSALFYNALALLGVGIGLASTLLTIRMLGISGEADIWLLGLAMISTLCILSQLGVEQFMYFHEEQLQLGPVQASRFARAAVSWALTTGMIFALVVVAVSPYLTAVFASGLPADAQARVAALIVAMTPQIAAAPLLHITRQYQNALERYTLAYLFLLWSPAVQLFILLLANWRNSTPELYAWVAGAGGLIQMAVCMLVMRSHTRDGERLAWTAPYFRRYISTSIAMRSGHAMHNFLSSAIINSTLSSFSVGQVAIFQYANRFAAGASTIAVGPHSNIFHARFAKAWATHAPHAAIESAHHFLKHIAPIYGFTVLVIWFALPSVIGLISQTAIPLDALATTFLLLSAWYGIVQLESVFVAVNIAAHGYISFILVNGLFAVLFYCLSRAQTGLPEYTTLPAAAALAQLVSLALYACVANHLFKRHFQANLGAA